MPDLKLVLAPQNYTHRIIILSLPSQIEANLLLQDVSDAFRSLWSDSAVEKAMQRSHQFHANDSSPVVYDFNSIKRMPSPSYVPTDQDILSVTSGASGPLF